MVTVLFGGLFDSCKVVLFELGMLFQCFAWLARFGVGSRQGSLVLSFFPSSSAFKALRQSSLKSFTLLEVWQFGFFGLLGLY